MAVRSPLIAIVGLPNVGKSTLFNRLIGEQRAVVEDLPGVTRDRNYARVERFSVPFVLVDTGGFDTQSNDPLQKLVQQQTLLAIEEADIILALFDGDAGVRPGDSDIVTLLREQEVPVHFLVNKIDGEEQSGKLADFYSLGVSELNAISAKHGFNVSDFIEETLQRLPNYPNLLKSHQERLFAEVQEQGEVLFAIAEAEREYGGGEHDDDDDDAIGDEAGDDISLTHEFPPVFVPEDSEFESAKDYDRAFKVKLLAERWEAGVVEDESSDETGRVGEDSATGPENRAPELIKIAIIGRPNVGKSTLLNTLVGEHRAITSEIAGTTRDSLDVEIVRDGQRYTIIDTAGLRKKQRIANRVERYSSFRALRSIADCDVAVVVLDGAEGPTMQDAKILGLAHDQGRGVVIVVNKWDLVEKDHRTVTEYKLRIREMFKFAPYAPIVFTSAISGRRCPWIITEARKVAISRLRRVTTGDLNRVLTKSLKRSPLAVYRGRPLRMYYGVQVAVAPPRFALFFNHPKAVHFSDLRFIKNEIRENFGFEGTEIKLVAKKRGEKDLTV